MCPVHTVASPKVRRSETPNKSRDFEILLEIFAHFGKDGDDEMKLILAIDGNLESGLVATIFERSVMSVTLRVRNESCTLLT